MLDSTSVINTLFDGESRLYGWCIIDRCVLTQDNIGKHVPNGDGCYVFVRREGDTLTITQDFLGSFGLYLYQADGYFALGNSFQSVVDHVKEHHPVTLNKRYAEYLMTCEMCSATYSETIVSEVRMLDRRAVVTIDIASGQLRVDLFDYEENTVDINSETGLSCLDAWYDKWSTLARSVVGETTNVVADLSGGFDTRLTLSILLPIMQDRGYVAINSIDDKLHTHAEDFQIASAMAQRYGFSLNDNSGLLTDTYRLPMEEVMELDYAFRLGFHKQMHYVATQHASRLYRFNGSGGECVRSYWHLSEDEFIQKALRRCQVYSNSTREQFEASVTAVLKSSIAECAAANEGCSVSKMQSFYRDTRCRHHFGKDTARNYCGGAILLSPLLDKDLHKLSLSSAQCADENLLCAIILSRYQPDLIDFPFEGGRSIAKETIAFAKALNAKHPYIPKRQEAVSPQSGTARTRATSDATEQHPDAARQPKATPTCKEQIEATLYRTAHTRVLEQIYEETLGRESYDVALDSMAELTWHPLSNMHAALAVCKAAQDAHAKHDSRQFVPWLLDLAQDDSQELVSWTHPRLHRMATMRVDLVGNRTIDSLTCKATGYRTRVNKPSWLRKDTCGYTIESFDTPIEIEVACGEELDLEVSLRGIDLRNSRRKRVPLWIECTKLEIDGDAIADAPCFVTFDKPLVLRRHVAGGSGFVLKIAWRPVNVLPPELALDDYLLREQALPNGKDPRRSELERRIKELEDEVSLLRRLTESKAYKFGNLVAAPVRAAKDMKDRVSHLLGRKG